MLVLSGTLARRAAQLERLLPPERPERRGRLISGGRTPEWAFHPDELRELPLWPPLGEVDMTAVIRRRLAEAGRLAAQARDAATSAARSNTAEPALVVELAVAAVAAWADADQLVTRHAPALRELRRRAEEVRLRAQEKRELARRRDLAKKGTATWRDTTARRTEDLLRAARLLQARPEYRKAWATTLARALSDQVGLSSDRIARILRAAGFEGGRPRRKPNG